MTTTAIGINSIMIYTVLCVGTSYHRQQTLVTLQSSRIMSPELLGSITVGFVVLVMTVSVVRIGTNGVVQCLTDSMHNRAFR